MTRAATLGGVIAADEDARVAFVLEDDPAKVRPERSKLGNLVVGARACRRRSNGARVGTGVAAIEIMAKVGNGRWEGRRHLSRRKRR